MYSKNSKEFFDPRYRVVSEGLDLNMFDVERENQVEKIKKGFKFYDKEAQEALEEHKLEYYAREVIEF